jgi:3-oxoacyl-[acyl-carrier protein] reductase
MSSHIDVATATVPAAFSLRGKRAVVTGASTGIGSAIALALGAAGAHVAGIDKADAERTAAGVREHGVECVMLQGDTGRVEDVERLAATAIDQLGGIDIWVNNAGADIVTGETAKWDWERKLELIFAVDLKGTMSCCREVAALMRAQPRGGTILNMSWDHVAAGMAGENPELFSAAKGGVLSYSKSLARSLAPRVRVNVLCPGWIETRFAREVDREFHRSVAESSPLARWGRPEDVAVAALWLASPEAAFVTGQAVNINGGVVM